MYAIRSYYAGLNSLEKVDEVFLIENNAMLQSISGIERITSLTGSIQIQSNQKLQSLSGLINLTQANGLGIYNNDALSSLMGLNNS